VGINYCSNNINEASSGNNDKLVTLDIYFLLTLPHIGADFGITLIDLAKSKHKVKKQFSQALTKQSFGFYA
jgi:hypothetical protein